MSHADDINRWEYRQQTWDSERPEIESSKDHGWFALHAQAAYGDGDREIHAVTREGQYVGTTYVGDHPSRPGALEGVPEVHPHYRRRGLASAMYDYASELDGKPMAPSDRHTDDAASFWNARRSDGRRLPTVQLRADLLDGRLPASLALPDDYVPDAADLLDAARDRVRGLVAVTATDYQGVAYAALRTPPGAEPAVDITNLVLAFLADEDGTPFTGDPAPRVAALGIVWTHDGPGLFAGQSIYAHGAPAVFALFDLLRAAVARTPAPDWIRADRSARLLAAATDLFADPADVRDETGRYATSYGLPTS